LGQGKGHGTGMTWRFMGVTVIKAMALLCKRKPSKEEEKVL